MKTESSVGRRPDGTAPPTQADVDSCVFQIAACVSRLNEVPLAMLAEHYHALGEIQLHMNGIYNASFKAHCLKHHPYQRKAAE